MLPGQLHSAERTTRLRDAVWLWSAHSRRESAGSRHFRVTSLRRLPNSIPKSRSSAMLSTTHANRSNIPNRSPRSSGTIQRPIARPRVRSTTAASKRSGCSTNTASSAGSTASMVLDFVDRLAAPLILTPHTVLADPSDRQRAILERLVARASRIMVMSAPLARPARRALRRAARDSADHPSRRPGPPVRPARAIQGQVRPRRHSRS